MRKIRVFLVIVLVSTIGVQPFTIIGLIQQPSPIISDDNRLIKIPLERINLDQSVTTETSVMALWGGSYWHQIPFEIIRGQDTSLDNHRDLNDSASSNIESLSMKEKDTIKIFIPYLKSQPCTDPPWWELAQQYKLNQRIRISLESSFNSLLEIYVYFGNSASPNFPRLLMVDIPYGTKTQYPTINSSTTNNDKPIEYFTLIDHTNIEITDNYQSGGGQGAASSKTVYDRGDFFDHSEFRYTGQTAQSQTQYLAPRDFINGESLVVSGTAHGDPWTRALSVKLNGVWLLYKANVYESFYYSWSRSTIHSYLDNDDGENTLEITLTTFTNDWYWRVDGYFTSYYTAEKHFNDQKSMFADNNNKYKFYYTGQAVQEFAVDVPRGISSATLKVYGKDYDSCARGLKVYVNDEQVLYKIVSGDFSESISVTNQAKYKDELKIGIVITTYGENNYWLVYGRLVTNARLEPFPDEPYNNNMWDGLTNTFMEGSVSLWKIDGNENYFLGDFDYYVRSLCLVFSPLYWGVHFYISEEAEQALEDKYCSGWDYHYLGVKYDIYAELTSSGWNTAAADFDQYYGSPTDTGEDVEEVGWLLTDTALDFANVWASASGSPAAAFFPLASIYLRWLKFLTRSVESEDRAYSNPSETKAIMDFRVQESDGSLGRMGRWYVLTQQGTRTFSISITIKIYLYYMFWTWYDWIWIEELLEDATISHSVSIVIP